MTTYGAILTWVDVYFLKSTSCHRLPFYSKGGYFCINEKMPISQPYYNPVAYGKIRPIRPYIGCIGPIKESDLGFKDL